MTGLWLFDPDDRFAGATAHHGTPHGEIQVGRKGARGHLQTPGGQERVEARRRFVLEGRPRLLGILGCGVGNAVGIEKDERLPPGDHPLIECPEGLAAEVLGVDDDDEIVVVVGNVLDRGSEVRDLVRLLEQAHRNPLLARLAALRRKHLGEIRVVGCAEQLEPRQYADPLRARPQKGHQSLRDLVLDRLLFLRPQEGDGILAAGLRLDGEAEEELIAMLIDRATLEPVLDGLDGLVGVR
jgi:hypothetical protein